MNTMPDQHIIHQEKTPINIFALFYEVSRFRRIWKPIITYIQYTNAIVRIPDRLFLTGFELSEANHHKKFLCIIYHLLV